MHKPDYKKLADSLGYSFTDINLLEMALSHRSVSGTNNERLEFLGDSIVNYLIAEALFHQYGEAKEGDLSRLRSNLINGDTLAEIAKEFRMGDYLRLGPGELKSGGKQRTSILADAMEAVIAAIYLDGGMPACKERVLKWYGSRLNFKTDSNIKDAKTRLQEYLQSKRLPLPKYSVSSISGEAHDQVFHVNCEIAELKIKVRGVGTNRRKAEQSAAEKALNKVEA
ncbi:MAG: ribonuclease III [Proteobacteria bacterium]|nr:ribonuclease III [Pseudomonadota bacterium]